MSIAACRLDRWGNALDNSARHLEMDYVKPPQNVVKKKKRKPEDHNSDDEFANVKAAALLRIHWSPAFFKDGDILYSRGKAVKETKGSGDRA